MAKIYIISQYRADNPEELEFNRKVARYYCRQILEEGNMPVAPHLYYTQFLDYDYPEDGKALLHLGLADLRASKEFLLVIVDGVISDGMKADIEEVARLGMRGRLVALTRQEAEDLIK